MKLPDQGQSAERVEAALAALKSRDRDGRDGRTFAYVYDPGPACEAVAHRAYLDFLGLNALDPTVFPSVLQLENQVVSIAADHLSGDTRVAGNFTTGGTESILLAVKTARDRARASRPPGNTPEMVLPVTAHAAFHKAAWYLGVRPVLVPVDPQTYRAQASAVRAALSPDTILMVGSAPSYAHGVVDDIPGLSDLAVETGIPLHVDACMGGWPLPYFRRLGGSFPDFDFRLPGVSSMSMDLHKYAFCPKGASVVLYRDRALREHQIFSCSSWTGYTIVNPTVLSTRSAGPMAAAWATLHFLGDDGYLSLLRTTRDATLRIVEGIAGIPGLRVMGEPDMCLVAVCSDEVDVFVVVDEMKARGWFLQAQLGYPGYRENFHLSVGPGNAPHVPAMLADLRACVEAARAVPPDGLGTMIAAAAAGLDPGAVPDEAFGQLLGAAGITGLDLPERMAGINGILNALPAALPDRFLVRFWNDLNHLGA